MKTNLDDNDLIYTKDMVCGCGSGLARPVGALTGWDCAAKLLGTAVFTQLDQDGAEVPIVHVGHFPLEYYPHIETEDATDSTRP